MLARDYLLSPGRKLGFRVSVTYPQICNSALQQCLCKAYFMKSTGETEHVYDLEELQANKCWVNPGMND